MIVITHTMYHRNKLDRLIQLFHLLTEMHRNINKITNKTKDVFLMYIPFYHMHYNVSVIHLIYLY